MIQCERRKLGNDLKNVIGFVISLAGVLGSTSAYAEENDGCELHTWPSNEYGASLI